MNVHCAKSNSAMCKVVYVAGKQYNVQCAKSKIAVQCKCAAQCAKSNRTMCKVVYVAGKQAEPK